MRIYGGMVKLSRGALSDPQVRSMAEECLRENWRATQSAIGLLLSDPEFFVSEQTVYKPTRESLIDVGIEDEAEIADLLADAETHEWPIYFDVIAWSASVAE